MKTLKTLKKQNSEISHMKWHSIDEDGLPSESGYYLVSKHLYFHEGGIKTIIMDKNYVDKGFFDLELMRFVDDDVVYAWVEIPDPM